MKLISHRGNTIGANSKQENSPDYILQASQKYDVEIDVWFIDGQFYLGHDIPTYKTHIDFLKNPRFWCHAKNIDALSTMVTDGDIHCFWHQADDVVLTSKGYLWTYPGKKLAKEKAIAVMPERVIDWDIADAAGVCSDFVEKYK